MHRGLRISVVIPCYNEEAGVQHVMKSLPDCVDEVVVVDNNCTDRTAEVAKSLGAKVIFEGKKGYGAAYKAGLPAATGDVIVTLDGDGTYPSEQIPDLLDLLEDKRLDFISACRFPLTNPKTMRFSNRIGNMVLTIAMLVVYRTPIKDSQSGMWVFRSSILPKLRLTSDGMALSEEIKIEAIRAKDVAFAEYPVNYHQRMGEVKLAKWRDGFRNLAFLVVKRFR